MDILKEDLSDRVSLILAIRHGEQDRTISPSKTFFFMDTWTTSDPGFINATNKSQIIARTPYGEHLTTGVRIVMENAIKREQVCVKNGGGLLSTIIFSNIEVLSFGCVNELHI